MKTPYATRKRLAAVPTPSPGKVDGYDPSRTGGIRKLACANVERQFAELGKRARTLMLAESPFITLTANGEYASTQFDVTAPEMVAAIKAVQDRIDPSDLEELEDTPHITLRYGLHDSVELASRVALCMQKVGAITAYIRPLSLFQTPGRPDVLKFDIEGQQLHELHGALGVLPNTTTHPEYRPHMTVAYVKEGTGYKYLDTRLPPGIIGGALTFTRLVVSGKDRTRQDVTLNAAWAPGAPREQVKAFRDWLRLQTRELLTSTSQEVLWDRFTESAYKQGVTRTVNEAPKKPSPPGTPKVVDQFVRAQAILGMMNPDRVKAIKGMAFDNVKGMSEDALNRLSRVLSEGLSKGHHPRTIANEMAKQLGISKARALVIARTECLPAETPIDGAVVRAVFRRWYVGDMVEIETRNGRKLSATPNHPMLTSAGWVAAGLLNEGDRLVCRRIEQNPGAPGNQDVQRTPTTIGEIFDSLQTVGRLERVGGSQPDFHGDGMDGEVDVLSTDRELVVGSFTPLTEHCLENVLPPSDRSGFRKCPNCGGLFTVDQRVHSCLRTQINTRLSESVTDGVGVGVKTGSDGGKGFSRRVPAHNLIGRNVGTELVSDTPVLPCSRLGLGIGARNSTFLDELPNPTDIVAGNSTDLLGGHTREVELDDVVLVRLRKFAGHVYNLETSYGYFVASGLYTKNCIRAHAEGQLDAMERMGIKNVKANVEFSTAHKGVCPKCAHLSGKVFTIKSAKGLIPVHPRCRCCFTPALGKKATGRRPKPVENSFCPTGPGGGVDPHCSPGVNPAQARFVESHPDLSPLIAAHSAAKPGGRVRQLIDDAVYAVSPGQSHDATIPPARLESPHRVRVELARRHHEYVKDGLLSREETGVVEKLLESLGARRVGTVGETIPFDPEFHATDQGTSTGSKVRVLIPGWTGLYGRADTGYRTDGMNWLRAVVTPVTNSVDWTQALSDLRTVLPPTGETT